LLELAATLDGVNATAPLSAPLSIAAWADLPEDTPGELVQGALVEEEMPDFLHEAIVAWLVATLRAWAIPRGGIVGGSEAKFALGPGLGRKPDLSAFLPPNLPPRRGVVSAPPYLMVEVISRSARDARRDRVEKPAEYETFGVRHLWLVDPEAQTVEGFVLGDGGRYVRSFSASEGRVAPAGFEGLVIELDALWAEVARLGE
jgi:Uma2 family endonuclease